MAIINNIPDALVMEHMNWHDFPGQPNKGGRAINPWPPGAIAPAPGSGEEFLKFHRSFMDKFFKWVNSLPTNQRPSASALKPWKTLPATLKQSRFGWDLQTARDTARLQHPEAFATLDELGVFIEWGIHPFFHHAAALRWNEPVLETMESLRSTYFYQIHGLVDLWRAKWVKAH